MKVIHLPKSMGSNAYYLSKCENILGIESDTLYTNPHKYDKHQPTDVNWFDNRFLYPFRAISFYFKAVKKYDIMHFNGGSTLLTYNRPIFDMVDLFFLSLTKVKIVMTFQGTDCRSATYCLKNYEVTHYKYYTEKEMKKIYRLERRIKKRLKKVSKYVDQIYAISPDIINNLPERAIFRPITKLLIDEWTPIYSDYSSEKFTIVHAPSNRRIKGTDVIEKTVNRLIDEGYNIELKLVEGYSNEQACEIYRTADLAIDQIYVGWYGGFAVELMALGKPVIAYIRESDLVNIPKEMKDDIPIISAHGGNLYDVLKSTIEEKHKLPDIAKRSRTYVEKWHNSIEITKKIVNNYYKLFEE